MLTLFTLIDRFEEIASGAAWCKAEVPLFKVTGHEISVTGYYGQLDITASTRTPAILR